MSELTIQERADTALPGVEASIRELRAVLKEWDEREAEVEPPTVKSCERCGAKLYYGSTAYGVGICEREQQEP